MKFCFRAAPGAAAAAQTLTERYGNAAPEEADVLIALGGDGFMLETLHMAMPLHKPVFGMNCGSVGFLMNDFHVRTLPERVAAAAAQPLRPLRITALTASGETIERFAFNEVSLLRQTRQAAKLRLGIDDKIRLAELICDGLLLSTPAGSTAYNFSADGPVLPIGSNVLALTAVSPFRPRRWRGAVLPREARVAVSVLEPEKRPVSAAADHSEIRDVLHAVMAEDHQRSVTVLFDSEYPLSERIIREQFAPYI